MIGLMLMIMESAVVIEGDCSPIVSQTHHKLEITDYFIPFGNCTVIAFVPNKATRFLQQKEQHAPIILFALDFTQGEIIDHKFSIVARRNPSPHCWTSFLILPEMHENFILDKKYLDTPSEANFISPYWSNQYFIWITTIKNDIQKCFERWKYAEMYQDGIRDVILITVKMHKNELISSNGSDMRIYYKNQYYMHAAIVDVESAPSWLIIDCLPNECYNLIESMVTNVSMSNKYIWTTFVKLDTQFTTINKLLSVLDFAKVQTKSRHGYQKIADLVTFNTFVSYWVLQDVIRHSPGYVVWSHVFPSITKPPSYPGGNFNTYVALEMRRFTPVSCYGVKRANSGILAAIMAPFDWETWTCILISVSIFILICSLLSIASNGSFFAIAMFLEKSELSLKHISSEYISAVDTLIVTWAIMIGIILPNLYKTFFTMEMIIPMSYKSSWKSIADIEGLRILIPFNLLVETEVDSSQMSDLVQHYYFFRAVLVRLIELYRLAEANSGLDVNSNMSKHLLNIIGPHFGLGVDGRTYGNGTFNRSSFGLESPYNKSEFKDIPVQPVLYREPNVTLKALTSCEKVVFMDMKGNIDAILPFLNDNRKGIKFLKGNDDTLFAEYRGWSMLPIRNNYALGRLKVMISSGIFSHWETLYYLWKPRKLFHTYSNWTHPKFNSVSQLDVNSKISTAFYICRICLLFSVAVLAMEASLFLLPKWIDMNIYYGKICYLAQVVSLSTL